MRIKDFFPSIMKKSPAIQGIPEYRKNLLFISHKKPKAHGFGMNITISLNGGDGVAIAQDCVDPSTIYSKLPSHDPRKNEEVDKLSYFPSYSGMTPTQRGLYLRWLGDISVPIDIGYVFTYFYGLERHLVLGNFDSAFDEILLLRRHHSNSSFDSYSSSALVHACLLKHRVDKLQQLYKIEGFNYFGNSNLLILHHSNLDILPDMMFELASRITGANRRYIKLQPDIYKEKIKCLLMDKFGKSGYPISTEFSLEGINGISYAIFANLSLPPEVRTPSIPNLMEDSKFQERMKEFFGEVHELTKSQLKLNKKKPNKSSKRDAVTGAPS